MSKKYTFINKKLKEHFGNDDIKIVPCDWSSDFEYSLRFENDNVTEDDIETAVNFVNSIMPTDWSFDDAEYDIL